MKKVVVFGATGQAGSYLVESLKKKNCFVVAPGVDEIERIDFTSENCFLFRDILEATQPDEIYNFAAKMYAPDSWRDPLGYMRVNGLAVLELLDAIVRYCPKAKLFQAGSADIFDKNSSRQDEETECYPDSPYGEAKLLAYRLVKMYREKRKLFACTGIFFNMESPRRKESFFAQKVVKEAVRIQNELAQIGKCEPMVLGKLGSKRDWGWAPEYIEVAQKMLQTSIPKDYVIGTGDCYSCRQFVEQALLAVGIQLTSGDFDKYVIYDDGDKSGNTMRAYPWKVERDLKWKAKNRMQDVVRMLVEAEKEKSAQGIAVR